MKSVRRWLKSILCFAMLVLLASCVTSTYTANDSSVGNMSYEQAYSIAVGTLKTGYNNVADVKFPSNHIILVLTTGKTISRVRNLDKITELKVDGNTKDILVTEGTTQYSFPVPQKGWEDKINLVKAIYVLSRHAVKTKKDNDRYFEDFASSLSGYRDKIASNVSLPEAANKYKLQAEGAVRDKDFHGAVGYLKKATAVAPWWPDGYFNLALMLSELGENKLAMRFMNCYLQLVPDAPNAYAAQKQIYEWERLESKWD